MRETDYWELVPAFSAIALRVFVFNKGIGMTAG